MRLQKATESRAEYLLRVARAHINSHACHYPIDFDGHRTEDSYSFLDALDNEIGALSIKSVKEQPLATHDHEYDARHPGA